MKTNLSSHLSVSKYGDFELTDAIRPAVSVPVQPREGFRIDTYRDRGAGLEVPVLAAAVSRPRLFDCFIGLLEPLGAVVDVVLETSHDRDDARHKDLYRHHIDLPVLESILYDYEDLLLNDGCTGIAVVCAQKPMEVQFDEHKLLVVYARNLSPFSRSLLNEGVPRDDLIRLITDGEHLHTTAPRHAAAFQEMAYRLGADEAPSRRAGRRQPPEQTMP